MPRRILVAGASGRLGRHLVVELKNRGFYVRAWGRDAARLRRVCPRADEFVAVDALARSNLRPVCAGVDQIISCLGASVIPCHKYGRRLFSQVDVPANERIVEAALAEKVGHFAYVSIYTDGSLKDNDFVTGHEQVERIVNTSFSSNAIIRSTGFFESLVQIMREANYGLIPQNLAGSARTNPIHEADLAAFCADLVERCDTGDYPVGGPETLTRREIASAVLGACSRSRPVAMVPTGLLRWAAVPVSIANPRVAELWRFIAHVLSFDHVAPAFGFRTLGDYLVGRQLHHSNAD